MGKVNSTIGKRLSELELPPQVEQPNLIPMSVNMIPTVVFSIVGEDPQALQQIADDEIKPRLENIKGVYQVVAEGGSGDQVLISIDPAKLNEAGISLSQVAGILALQNYSSLDQIENTPLSFDATLKNIAEVELGPKPGSLISRTDGKPSLTVLVMKNPNANTVETAHAVMAEVKEIEIEQGDSVKFLTVFDQSEFIEQSIKDLTKEGVEGAILAVIVIFLFLMVVRASLVTAISIPLSILIGFLLMRGWGLTINLITLSAMGVAVGRVVDDSIVMLEVIYRRMQQGESFKKAALNGSREVATPITSATLATVVIFIPLAFVGGIVSEVFTPFALAITFAFIASLLVALMLVPALSGFIVPRKKPERKKKKDAWYSRSYTSMLRWSLKHRAATLAIAVLLFLGSLSLLPIIGTTFMPSSSEKLIAVEVEMPHGTELSATSAKAAQVEEIVGQNPKVKTYNTTIGTSATALGAMSSASGAGSNTAAVIILLDPDANLEKETERLRLACGEIAGESKITVLSGAEAEMSGMGSNNLRVSVMGENSEEIATVTGQLLDKLKNVDGLENTEVDIAQVRPKLDVEINEEKMATSGITPEELGQLRMLVARGGTVAQASIDGKTREVFIERLAEHLDLDTASSLVVSPNKTVTLGDIANVEIVQQPTYVRRLDEKQAAVITANITKKNVGGVNQAVQEEINALSLPSGIEIKMGGIAEEMKSGFNQMYIAIGAAVVIAYFIVVIFMRSFLNPLIIMISLPLASIGALLGLLIAGKPLGLSGLMGVLMLIGIVLTNAIVLITLVEQLRKKGMSTYDALMEGGRTRLRPILMTALTTMIAMVPMAIGLEESVLMAAELATVVIGGLFTSTLLTLLVLPVIYSLTERWHRRQQT
jgi:HAE1 family hydrophobic/amphiphilic exporter-1